MSLDFSVLRAEKLGKTIREQVKFTTIESHSIIRTKSDLGSHYKGRRATCRQRMEICKSLGKYTI